MTDEARDSIKVDSERDEVFPCQTPGCPHRASRITVWDIDDEVWLCEDCYTRMVETTDEP